MSLTYGTSTILFALKILPFQHGLLLGSPNHKSRYGHSADNVRENVSGYRLGLTVFALSKNYEARIQHEFMNARILENFVSIVVPRVLLKCLFLKCKYVISKHYFC